VTAGFAIGLSGRQGLQFLVQLPWFNAICLVAWDVLHRVTSVLREFSVRSARCRNHVVSPTSCVNFLLQRLSDGVLLCVRIGAGGRANRVSSEVPRSRCTCVRSSSCVGNSKRSPCFRGCSDKTNIMADRRVVRGNTYSAVVPTVRALVAETCLIEQCHSFRSWRNRKRSSKALRTQSASARQRLLLAMLPSVRHVSALFAPEQFQRHRFFTAQQRALDAKRAASPEPFPGRSHMGAQTDNVLEELVDKVGLVSSWCGLGLNLLPWPGVRGREDDADRCSR
jgi:hypothetical protein